MGDAVMNAERADEFKTPIIAGEPWFRYFAFGLKILSQLELPELAVGGFERPDVIIREASLARRIPNEGEEPVAELGGSAPYFAWGGIGHFRIKNASVIEYECHPKVEKVLLSFPLLGAVFATLLHLRGYLILHASSVGVSGCAVTFMGDKGAGKSTTAGAMIRAGHRLLTDDVVVIDWPQADQPVIIPGYPQLKVSKSAEAHLALDGVATLKTGPYNFEKARLRLQEEFSSSAVRPAIFYVLQTAGALGCAPLSNAEGMVALMRFSYMARFGSQILNGASASRHMAQCAKIASQSNIRRLEVPTSLDQLGALVKFIEQDISSVLQEL